MSKEQIPCKYVTKEGEGCRANNNCKYPNCPPPNRGLIYDADKALENFHKIDWSILDDPNLLKDKDASKGK